MADDTSRHYARLFWLQSAARDIMGKERTEKGNLPRVCACCRIAVPGRNVQVWGRVDIKRAKYRNVVRCADVWQCPVCANHITAHRRDDLQYVIDVLNGTIPIMISFTISHTRKDSLSDSMTILGDAWRSMTTCKCFREYRKDTTTKGHVRSLEVTWGQQNGWHPHYHALFFMGNHNHISGFYADIRSMWAEHVSQAGGNSSWEHACHLTVAENTIAQYIAKWGHEPSEDTLPQLSRWGKAQELTRGPMKSAESGRYTPFEILEEYLISQSPGPAYWAKLYRDYAKAMKGQRQLTWSRTPDLRKAAGLDDERAEIDIIEGDEAGYVLLAQLDNEQWDAIVWAGMRGVVLDCCARGDVSMAVDVINDCMAEQYRALTSEGRPFTLESVNVE